MITAILTVLGLGFVYFVGAIPAGVALKMNPVSAAIVAWIGYSLGSWLVVLVGKPLQELAKTRIKLLREPRDESKFFWKVWKRFGLAGLALIAPVTCGPQTGSLVALALGENPTRVGFWFTIGVIPYAIAFTLIAAFGKHLVGAP